MNGRKIFVNRKNRFGTENFITSRLLAVVFFNKNFDTNLVTNHYLIIIKMHDFIFLICPI